MGTQLENHRRKKKTHRNREPRSLNKRQEKNEIKWGIQEEVQTEASTSGKESILPSSLGSPSLWAHMEARDQCQLSACLSPIRLAVL